MLKKFIGILLLIFLLSSVIIYNQYGKIRCVTHETLYNYSVGGTITSYYCVGETFPFNFFHGNMLEYDYGREG
jgi:hypothetical protein